MTEKYYTFLAIDMRSNEDRDESTLIFKAAYIRHKVTRTSKAQEVPEETRKDSEVKLARGSKCSLILFSSVSA